MSILEQKLFVPIITIVFVAAILLMLFIILRKMNSKRRRRIDVSSTALYSSSSTSSIGGYENFGWGRWYSMRELRIATDQFSLDRVIGQGGHGIVYRAELLDGSVVAVKKLLYDNRDEAEKDFKVEVEAIGKVKHKNLVSLLGYCAEGAQRLLVYEYIENGNLAEWLYGNNEPLTWEDRMKIVIGTARGLAYLHEGLEPKVIHRDVKSDNILLDNQLNARMSDFGLVKLLESEKRYVTTRVMGTLGYVSPDYECTGMLNETSDVYSFGVLFLEIITGKRPIDEYRGHDEVKLVDWFKRRVASCPSEEFVDPLIKVLPPTTYLNKTLQICLQCIDLDANKRPKMGQIVHMLEDNEFPIQMECCTVYDTARFSTSSSI